MALDQANLKGVLWAAGTQADIDAASGSYVTGRVYCVTTTGKLTGVVTKIGDGFSPTFINWRASKTEVEAVASDLAAEINRATGSESNLQQQLDAETLARTSADEALDVAFRAADASLETALTVNLTNAVNALRDERVTDFVGVDYTSGQNVALSSILVNKGSETTLRDGIHLFKFNSTDIQNVATLSGLPSGAANMSISYNDIVKVVVDGGVAVSATLVDDVLKAKLDSVDSAIADIQAATTPTAIRSHISATGFITFTNGVIDGSLSSDVNNSLVLLNGKPFFSLKDAYLQFVNDSGNPDDGSVSFIIDDIYSKIGSLNAATVTAASGVQNVGGVIKLGGNALDADTNVSGAFDMKFSTPTVTFQDGVIKIQCWDIDTDGLRTTPISGKFLTGWADLNSMNWVVPNLGA